MDLKVFNKTVGLTFDKPLADNGFKLKRKKTEKLYCERLYINGDRYVKISGNVHPMDFPPHYSIVLGQGSYEWPDCDWNSVALCRIKKTVDPKEKVKEYSLEQLDEDKLGHSLSHSKNELLNYGQGFLSGDIELFEKVRREQNKDREPYKIYKPTENGGRGTLIDEESKALKKKYS
jgi:hypothetical protein